MEDIKSELLEIIGELDSLENFYNKDYINLETYFKIKKEIIIKYISVGEYYKSEVEDRINTRLYSSKEDIK